MKAKLLTLFIAIVLLFGCFSCEDTISNDITLENPEMSGDPDEPQPGCDDPDGCGGEITKGD